MSYHRQSRWDDKDVSDFGDPDEVQKQLTRQHPSSVGGVQVLGAKNGRVAPVCSQMAQMFRLAVTTGRVASGGAAFLTVTAGQRFAAIDWKANMDLDNRLCTMIAALMGAAMAEGANRERAMSEATAALATYVYDLVLITSKRLEDDFLAGYWEAASQAYNSAVDSTVKSTLGFSVTQAQGIDVLLGRKSLAEVADGAKPAAAAAPTSPTGGGVTKYINSQTLAATLVGAGIGFTTGGYKGALAGGAAGLAQEVADQANAPKK